MVAYKVCSSVTYTHIDYFSWFNCFTFIISNVDPKLLHKNRMLRKRIHYNNISIINSILFSDIAGIRKCQVSLILLVKE